MSAEPEYTSAATRRQDRALRFESPETYKDELDEFGFDNFVELVADQLIDKPGRQASGLVVGVTGPWGSGKTFVLDWVCSEVTQRLGDNGLLIRFDPWRVRGREDVLLAFIRKLSQEVALAEDSTKSKLLNAFPKDLRKFLGKHFNKGKETAQSALDVYEKGLGKVLKIITAQTVDQTYEKLALQLKKVDVPIVAVIDDLDRLDDAEIRDIAMLVKSVGHFENVSYLLAYDPRRVARALTNSGDIEEGLQYLEKIVQLQLRLPRVPRSRLRKFARELLEVPEKGDWYGFSANLVSRVLNDLVPDILWTPRDLVRFGNLARARMFKRDKLYVPDLLRFAALEVRFPLLSDRLASLVGRCTIDGIREIRRCQGATLEGGEDVIDFLLHGESQQSADRGHPNSRALLKLLFPALRPEGTEHVARPVERLCYENSLKTALNHQQKEELLTVDQADQALSEPRSFLARRLEEAAENDLLRHAHLRLRTQYRQNGSPQPEVVWQTIAAHFDSRPESGIENWSMFLDLSHVWVRGAVTRFIDASDVITKANVADWIKQGYIHLPACLLYFECSGHELHGLKQRANLRPFFDESDIKELLELAAEEFAERIIDPKQEIPPIKSLFPLWVVSKHPSAAKRGCIAKRLSAPSTAAATDAVVCLLYRTWHETVGEFTLQDFIDRRKLLQYVREHSISEERLPLPVQTAYQFVQDNLFAP